MNVIILKQLVASGDVNIGEYSHVDFVSVITVITVYDICRLQNAECRLQTADCRSQIVN